MPSRTLRVLLGCFTLWLVAFATPSFAAKYIHARIVRLSLVQGDVKVYRGADARENGAPDAWELAVANLPIREGFVLATGDGRAEVEFENGAAAYLAEDSVLEFTELALSDGARRTKLTLRQGTAAFYAHPARDDSFTAKASDLDVSLASKGRFRLDAFSDGAFVSVLQGRADVRSRAGAQVLEKGQALTFRANAAEQVSLDRVPPEDDFDHWVAGREETVASATNSALQYVSSPAYTSGFADLSTYGNWVSLPGYGFGWHPFGAGFGWSPFATGRWVYFRGFGWTWVSFEPWGWTPYHFGSWIFSPALGWLWVPGGFGWGGPGFWRPATCVWVRAGRQVGIVPLHPQDARGRTPINLSRGIISRPSGEDSPVVQHAGDLDARVKVLKGAPRDFTVRALPVSSGEIRAPRSIEARAGTMLRDTGDARPAIVYDPRERRFVNANTAPASGSPSRHGPVRGQDAEPDVGGRRSLDHVVLPGRMNAATAPAVPATTVPATTMTGRGQPQSAPPAASAPPANPRATVTPRPSSPSRPAAPPRTETSRPSSPQRPAAPPRTEMRPAPRSSSESRPSTGSGRPH